MVWDAVPLPGADSMRVFCWIDNLKYHSAVRGHNRAMMGLDTSFYAGDRQAAWKGEFMKPFQRSGRIHSGYGERSVCVFVGDCGITMAW